MDGTEAAGDPDATGGDSAAGPAGAAGAVEGARAASGAAFARARATRPSEAVSATAPTTAPAPSPTRSLRRGERSSRVGADEDVARADAGDEPPASAPNGPTSVPDGARATISRVLSRRSKATVTAMRQSHVRKGASPRKLARRSNARANAHGVGALRAVLGARS